MYDNTQIIDRVRAVHDTGWAAPVVVDDKGNLYQMGRKLPIHVNKGNGYAYTAVRLASGGTRTLCVHRLVARAWLGEPTGEVDHRNRKRTDNRPTNLRYVTHRENQRRLGTRRAISRGTAQAWRRRKEYPAGIYAYAGDLAQASHYDTVREAADATGVPAVTIYRILRNAYGFRTAHGHTFVADLDTTTAAIA